MELTLSFVDWCIVATTIAAAVYAGIRYKPVTSSAVDYVLAGRKLTAPLFAVSLIATWYGAVLGATEFVVTHGVVMIVCFGVPYYIAATFYALFLSKRMRMANTVSIPHQIVTRYGGRAGVVAAVILLFIAIPAPYILSIGIIGSSVTGLPLNLCIVAGTMLSLAIVAKGGLRSDAQANVVQATVMYLGFIVLFVSCWHTFGSPATLINGLPEEALSIPGSLGYTGLAVWMFIALQTFIDPNFHVRVAASLTPDHARRGLLYSVLGWIIFDALQLGIGLYALAYAPTDPATSLPALANMALPPIAKGVFVSGVLAAIISTLDGYALTSATIIGHDIMPRLSPKNIFSGGSRPMMVGLFITGVVGIMASVVVPSVVELLFHAASVAVPGILLPLLMSYRVQQRSLLAIVPVWLWILIPAVTALITIVLNVVDFWSIEPMLVGLCTSVVLMPFADTKHHDD